MAWKTLDDLDVADKVVLVRVDLNVPVENGVVTDATRIERIAPTVRDILTGGGKPVLMAHFGRPKGQRVPEMSLIQIKDKVAEILGLPVSFAEDCIGGPAKSAVAEMKAGEVLLLENTRFHAGEEANDAMFAASLAALGQVYVNDAFSAAHRAHASTEALAELMPAGAGRLMEAELKALEAALSAPERPLMAVVGGAKVSTKLDLLGNLVRKVNTLVIGGGINGAGIARDAAGRGLKVLLVEKDDLGSHTSSASTKLVHGGLRGPRARGHDAPQDALGTTPGVAGGDPDGSHDQRRGSGRRRRVH